VQNEPWKAGAGHSFLKFPNDVVTQTIEIGIGTDIDAIDLRTLGQYA
jgi:hypothetical protein